MSKDESIVKSFRMAESQFTEANEIFRKEGFSFSEVIRLLFEATIREGRIPRSLSTKNIECSIDAAKEREKYIDSILDMALPNPDNKDIKDAIFGVLFGEPSVSKDMTNAQLRDWGDKWGLPDGLSVATLADLHDCELFSKDPWFGIYDYVIDNDVDNDTATMMIMMKFSENIKDHMEQVKREMQAKAIKKLMASDIRDIFASQES